MHGLGGSADRYFALFNNPEPRFDQQLKWYY